MTKKKANGTRKKRKGSTDVFSSESLDFVQKKKKRKKPLLVEVDDDLDVAATNLNVLDSNTVRKSRQYLLIFKSLFSYSVDTFDGVVLESSVW